MHSYMFESGGHGVVDFPTPTGKRHYMLPVVNGQVPLEAIRYSKVVKQMLYQAGIPKPPMAYLMVDEQQVRAGECSRRPGLHVDMYWHPGSTDHGHNSIQAGHYPQDRHYREPPVPPSHTPGHGSHSSDNGKEALLLLSNIGSARAMIGDYSQESLDLANGDASKVKGTFFELPMQANKVYIGNVWTLHESLPVARDCYRTVVRLNIPDWEPTIH